MAPTTSLRWCLTRWRANTRPVPECGMPRTWPSWLTEHTRQSRCGAPRFARCLCDLGQGDPDPWGEVVELADVAEREGTKERAQPGRGTDPGEQPAQPSVASIHVSIKSAGDHPGDPAPGPSGCAFTSPTAFRVPRSAGHSRAPIRSRNPSQRWIQPDGAISYDFPRRPWLCRGTGQRAELFPKGSQSGEDRRPVESGYEAAGTQ
jgi:hypothetical protein